MTSDVGKPARKVHINFGDGRYPCRLTLDMIAEVQSERDAGIGLIYRRVLAGRYDMQDLIEVVRYGLVGGGMEGVRAGELIDRYGSPEVTPVARWQDMATSILSVMMHGYRGGEGGGKKPEEAPEPMKDGST